MTVTRLGHAVLKASSAGETVSFRSTLITYSEESHTTSLGDRPLLGASVQERDIDLILVQVVETAPDFRQCLCSQLQPT